MDIHLRRPGLHAHQLPALRGARASLRLFVVAAAVGFVLAACGSDSKEEATAGPSDAAGSTGTATVEASPGAEGNTGASGGGNTGTDEELRNAPFSTRGWETDFSQRNVALSEIMSGGPPRDGIPSVDEPRFISVAEADEWLDDRGSVQIVEIDGDARAYPIQILMWHEIVNDTVAGVPIAVTYCPLCNTAIVFERMLPEVGEVEFGVSGNLYNSAMVMYDRATETWFWQVSGEGIVGSLTGHRLTMLPSTLTSWEEFKRAHPDGQVLSRETGFDRNYGRNPYTNYDTSSPFLFRGDHDERLPAMERVVAVELGGESAAFPFSALIEQPVVHTEVGGEPIVVFYRPGAASPLDASAIAQGRDVGSSGVYRPEAGGQSLTFEATADGFRDLETGSTWNLLGEAVSGPLAGERLEPVVHGNHFWFSWAVYQPDTRIVRGG